MIRMDSVQIGAELPEYNSSGTDPDSTHNGIAIKVTGSPRITQRVAFDPFTFVSLPLIIIAADVLGRLIQFLLCIHNGFETELFLISESDGCLTRMFPRSLEMFLKICSGVIPGIFISGSGTDTLCRVCRDCPASKHR